MCVCRFLPTQVFTLKETRMVPIICAKFKALYLPLISVFRGNHSCIRNLSFRISSVSSYEYGTYSTRLSLPQTMGTVRLKVTINYELTTGVTETLHDQMEICFHNSQK